MKISLENKNVVTPPARMPRAVPVAEWRRRSQRLRHCRSPSESAKRLMGTSPHCPWGSSLRGLLAWAQNQLAAAQIENPRHEAELLFAGLLGVEVIDLYLENKTVPGADAGRYQQMIWQRSQRYPLQYIMGRAFFRGFALNVREGVFIPRPETELLVETVIGLLPRAKKHGDWIWDLCCGTGNIAISLAKEMLDCKIIATDISPLALEIAAENVAQHNLCGRVSLAQGDLFAAGASNGQQFAAIVSNPPYIREETLKDLPLELKFEPRQALRGGSDGLSYYRRIIGQAAFFLKKGGFLAMEMGEEQGSAISSLFSQNPDYSTAIIVNDYNNRERIIYSQRL